MSRRIGLWVLLGIMVACCWVTIGFLAGPTYNPGRSTIAAITAPASLLGRKMPLGMLAFVLLNGGLYGVLGLAIESLRRTLHIRQGS
jgi:hypothetical protein